MTVHIQRQELRWVMVQTRRPSSTRRKVGATFVVTAPDPTNPLSKAIKKKKKDCLSHTNKETVWQ